MAITSARVRYSLLLVSLLIAGCSYISPHENFIQALHSSIGRSIDNVPPYLWPHSEDLIDSINLSNGNMKNRYKYNRGKCKYVFEINPKTRQIVGASFEGKESDCVINP